MIDLATRQAVVELNSRGARADDIAELLEAAARTQEGWEKMTIAFHPVATKDFAHQIENFGRIRVASVKVARPNPTLTTYYESFKRSLEESNGRTMLIEVTAVRGDSLKPSDGIIADLKGFLVSNLSPLIGASVRGTRKGETTETMISLVRCVEHQRVSVRRMDNGHVDPADMLSKIKSYLEKRAEAVKQ
jgi:hypothetical protein